MFPRQGHVRVHPLQRGMRRIARWYGAFVARTTRYTRTVLWMTAAVSLALLVFAANEAWLGYRLGVRVAQTQSENAHLRQDAAETARRAAWADSPGAIEDAARALGYARPGEQPVVIVIATPRTPQPLPAPPSSAASAPGGSSGSWLDPWHLIFGG